MAKSSSYWDKRAIKRLNEAEKTSEVYIERIKKIYSQAYKDIDEEIARVYKNYSKETGLDVQKLKELLTRSETKKTWEQMKRQGLDKYIKNNYKSRISRLEQIQAQIYAKAKQIYPKEELEQTMCYKGVINNSYYKAIYDTQMGTGYDFSFNKIDKNITNALLNEKWSGANYSQRIWNNTDILADSLSQVLGGALLSGQSIEKTTKQIKDRFNVSKYYAERLVRTETNHFNNEADAMAYEEMGIDKYVFVATLDSRTSETCQNHDGKVYEYKDKEVGVNFPPLHPNCRSKTRGYLGEEAEKTLKRRARNPITGKTEVIDNIPYNEWIKQYNETKIIEKPMTNIKKRDNILINNLPSEFSTQKEINNTNTVLDFINNQKNSNSKVVELYNRMGKIQKIPFKIIHSDKDYAVNIRTAQKEIRDVKLIIPNVNKGDIGKIETWLHENMHFIDFMLNNKDKNVYNNFYSTRDIGIKAILQTTRNKDIGEDVQKLFNEFNSQYKEVKTNIIVKYDEKFKELNRRFSDGEIEYSTYRTYWSKQKSLRSIEITDTARNLMGGGIDDLQDIYDALSGGEYRDNKTVIFGHGSKTYKDINSRIKETVANYGALSITRPDLVELLKKDKPQLVEQLDILIDKMLRDSEV